MFFVISVVKNFKKQSLNYDHLTAVHRSQSRL